MLLGHLGMLVRFLWRDQSRQQNNVLIEK